MKRRIIVLSLVLGLFAAQSVQALTEVITTIPAYWIERDGSLTLYGTVNGPCGSNTFSVSVTLANYDEVHEAAVMAMDRSYEMDLVVESCSGNKNVVTFAKICRDPAYC